MRSVVYLAALSAVAALSSSCSERSSPSDAPAPPEDHAAPPPATTGHDDPEDREAGAAHGARETLKLPPEAAKNAQITFGSSALKTLGAMLTVPARVAFTQQGHARVSSRVPGRITELPVVAGTEVKRGAVLAQVESQALGQARSAYLAATAKARFAQSNVQRERELFAKGISSERELREAEAIAAESAAELSAADASLHALGLEDAEIRALKADEHYGSRVPVVSPIAGTVVEVLGAMGQSIEPTAPLFVVGDLSELWVLLDVAESQLAGVTVGMSAVISTSARPGRQYEGKVAYVGDVVDARTRTVPVRVVVANSRRELKPGMFATAELVVGTDAGAETSSVVVPREAVQQVGDEEVVFVPVSEKEFRPVEVRTGRSTATEVEVVSGLEPGVRVVTGGAFILKSELSKESMGEGHAH